MKYVWHHQTNPLPPSISHCSRLGPRIRGSYAVLPSELRVAPFFFDTNATCSSYQVAALAKDATAPVGSRGVAPLETIDEHAIQFLLLDRVDNEFDPRILPALRIKPVPAKTEEATFWLAREADM